MVILALQTSTDYARRFSRSWVLLLAGRGGFRGLWQATLCEREEDSAKPVRVSGAIGHQQRPQTDAAH